MAWLGKIVNQSHAGSHRVAGRSGLASLLRDFGEVAVAAMALPNVTVALNTMPLDGNGSHTALSGC
jgi:hypothetical protein